MPTELLQRGGFQDLEIRNDGRTVVGLAVPFDTETDIGMYRETFRRGSFTRTISERGDRVKALAQHDHMALPLGRASALREESRGLVVELRISQTLAGDEALQLVKDKALDSLSIGFMPVRDRWSSDKRSVERLEVRLHEVSLVSFPAYEDARVMSVRGTQIPAHLNPDLWASRFGMRNNQLNPNTWAERLGLTNSAKDIR